MEKNVINKQRDSSIELFRIISMLLIVAHHYVVNSGLNQLITENLTLSFKPVFFLIFGWAGKTAINCFVIISGYFMCKSKITLKKFLKLLLEVEFYRIVIYFILIITRVDKFSIAGTIKTIAPFYNIGSSFTNSYLVFFLFIPFLNILINNMNKKQHMLLISLCAVCFSVIPTFFLAEVKIGYVSWFMIIYIIGAYIRIYPEKIFENQKIVGFTLLLLIFASWMSVIVGAYAKMRFNIDVIYYFVADSNKILALLTGVTAFVFFKNLKIGYSKFINTVAASAFGVLLIHSSSASMRKWLWKDLLNNTYWYNTSYCILHAVISVFGIYIVCTFIDYLRIKFLEKPFFKIYDKRVIQKKEVEK